MSNELNVAEGYYPTIAEDGKFFKISDEYLESIGYDSPSGHGKYALLTYTINGSTSGGGGDIEIGAVELKDGGSDTRATVLAGSTVNALAVSAINVESQSTVKIEDPVTGEMANVVDESGTKALAVSVSNWEGGGGGTGGLIYGPTVLLNQETATVSSSAIDLEDYTKLVVHVKSEDVPDESSGAVVEVQHSLNGTDWIAEHIYSLDENTLVEYASELALKYVRVAVTSYYDATATTKITATIYAKS